jgi:chromosome segregation protein
VSQRLAALTSQLQSLERERDRSHRELAECEASLQAVEVRHAESTAELRRVQDAIREAEHGREAAEQRRQMAGRAVEESKRQLEVDLRRLEEATARLTALDSDINDQRESIAAIAERAADAERSLDSAAKARATAADSIAACRGEHERAASALRTLERERSGLRSETQTLTHRIDDLDTERRKHAERAGTIDDDRTRARAERATAAAAIEQRGLTIAGLETEIATLAAKADDLAGAARQRSERVEHLSERRVGLDARRGTLDEMIRSRAGLAEAARWVMDRKESGDGFAGVVAPLAELVETDTAHAEAVEAALGADLQALVTRSVTGGPTPEEIRGLPGRVRFLPIEGLPAAMLRDGEPGPVPGLGALPGSRLTPLRDLVRARTEPAGDDTGSPAMPPVGRLLDRLLARTFLVENLDSALLLLAGPLADTEGVRIVTRRGEVIDRSGAVDAGPAGSEQGVGLIRHAAELTEIETDLASVGAELDREQGELGRLNDAWAVVNAEREAAAESLASNRRELVAEQSRADRLDADLDRLDREAAGVASEIERCETRHAELMASRDAKAARAGELDNQIDERQREADSCAERLESLQRDAEAASERMSTAREAASRANAELEAARRELSSLSRTRDETADSMGEHERHAEQARERHTRHESMIAEATEAIQRCESVLAEERGRLEAQQAATENTEHERRDVASLVTEARERARLVERDWHGVEASRRELEVKRESLEERTARTSGSIWGPSTSSTAVMAPGDVERVDIPDAQARINVLRGEIKKLGNVNLDAIAEEGQLAEADEDLIGPRSPTSTRPASG